MTWSVASFRPLVNYAMCPTFLHKGDRIEALMFVNMLGLLI